MVFTEGNITIQNEMGGKKEGKWQHWPTAQKYLPISRMTEWRLQAQWVPVIPHWCHCVVIDYLKLPRVRGWPGCHSVQIAGRWNWSIPWTSSSHSGCVFFFCLMCNYTHFPQSFIFYNCHSSNWWPNVLPVNEEVMDKQILNKSLMLKTKAAKFLNREINTLHHLLVGQQPEDVACISISSLSNLGPGTESVKTDHLHKVQSNPIIPISAGWHVLYHHILCNTSSAIEEQCKVVQ